MNKSFCPMAFKEIYTDNSGQYRLCCHAKQNNDLKKYNSSNTLPFEFFTSEEMENIRNDMFEGKLIDDCEVCYNLEKLTVKSHRTLKQLEKYGYDTELKNIGLKLRINGSYCNLSCYMCSPYNSSTRRNELKTVFGPNNKWQKDNFKFKKGHYFFDMYETKSEYQTDFKQDEKKIILDIINLKKHMICLKKLPKLLKN